MLVRVARYAAVSLLLVGLVLAVLSLVAPPAQATGTLAISVGVDSLPTSAPFEHTGQSFSFTVTVTSRLSSSDCGQNSIDTFVVTGVDFVASEANAIGTGLAMAKGADDAHWTGTITVTDHPTGGVDAASTAVHFTAHGQCNITATNTMDSTTQAVSSAPVASPTFKIDNVKPNVVPTFTCSTPGTNNWCKDASGTVTANPTDGSGIATSSCTSGPDVSHQNPFTCGTPLTIVQGQTVVCESATDASGNSASACNDAKPFKLDNTPPTVSIAQACTPNVNGWCNVASTTATPTITDSVSGLNGATCSLDGNTPSSCTSGTATTINQGSHTLCVTATDNAGNQFVGTAGNGGCLTVRTDNVAPTAAVSTSGTTCAAGSVSPWCISHVGVWTASASDTGTGASGINASACQLDGSAVACGSITQNAIQGFHNVCVNATDLAGNSAPMACGPLFLDDVPPVLSNPVPTPTPVLIGGQPWNKGPVTVTWSCSDATSGSPATVSAPRSTDGTNLQLQVSCTDNAGNVAQSTFGPVNIDSTPPTIVSAVTVPSTLSTVKVGSMLPLHVHVTDAGVGVQLINVTFSPDPTLTEPASFNPAVTVTCACSSSIVNGAIDSDISVPVPALIPGHYRVNVTAVDALGNEIPQSAQTTVASSLLVAPRLFVMANVQTEPSPFFDNNTGGLQVYDWAAYDAIGGTSLDTDRTCDAANVCHVTNVSVFVRDFTDTNAQNAALYSAKVPRASVVELLPNDPAAQIQYNGSSYEPGLLYFNYSAPAVPYCSSTITTGCIPSTMHASGLQVFVQVAIKTPHGTILYPAVPSTGTKDLPWTAVRLTGSPTTFTVRYPPANTVFMDSGETGVTSSTQTWTPVKFALALNKPGFGTPTLHLDLVNNSTGLVQTGGPFLFDSSGQSTGLAPFTSTNAAVCPAGNSCWNLTNFDGTNVHAIPDGEYVLYANVTGTDSGITVTVPTTIYFAVQNEQPTIDFSVAQPEVFSGSYVKNVFNLSYALHSGLANVSSLSQVIVNITPNGQSTLSNGTNGYTYWMNGTTFDPNSLTSTGTITIALPNNIGVGSTSGVNVNVSITTDSYLTGGKGNGTSPSTMNHAWANNAWLANATGHIVVFLDKTPPALSIDVASTMASGNDSSGQLKIVGTASDAGSGMGGKGADVFVRLFDKNASMVYDPTANRGFGDWVAASPDNLPPAWLSAVNPINITSPNLAPQLGGVAVKDLSYSSGTKAWTLPGDTAGRQLYSATTGLFKGYAPSIFLDRSHTYRVDVYAIDSLGNTNAATPQSFDISFDGTPPVIASALSGPTRFGWHGTSDNQGNGGAGTLLVNASDNQGFTSVYLTGTAPDGSAVPAVPFTAVLGEDSAHHVVGSNVSLTNGSAALSVSALDLPFRHVEHPFISSIGFAVGSGGAPTAWMASTTQYVVTDGVGSTLLVNDTSTADWSVTSVPGTTVTIQFPSDVTLKLDAANDIVYVSDALGNGAMLRAHNETFAASAHAITATLAPRASLSFAFNASAARTPPPAPAPVQHFALDIAASPLATDKIGAYVYNAKAVDAAGSVTLSPFPALHATVQDTQPAVVTDLKLDPPVVPVGTRSAIVATVFENYKLAHVNATLNRILPTGVIDNTFVDANGHYYAADMVPLAADTAGNGTGTWIARSDVELGITNLTGGAYIWSIRAIDATPSNCVPECAVRSILVKVSNDTAPQISLDSPTTTFVNLTPTFTWRVQSNAITQQQITLSVGPQGGTLAQVTPTFTALAPVGSTSTGYQVAWSPTLAGLTNYTVQLTATGNGLTSSLTSNFTVDGVPPTLAANVTGTTNVDGVTYATPGTRVALVATDDATSVASLTYSINGGPAQTYTTPIVPTGPDGAWQLDATATDGAGNVNKTTVTLMLDATRPVISLASPAGDTLLVTVSDAGSGVDPTSVTVHYAYGDNLTFQTLAMTKAVGNSYTITLPGNATQDGLRFWFDARDRVGNDGTLNSTTSPLVVKRNAPPVNQPPTVHITSPANNSQQTGGVDLAYVASDPDSTNLSVTIALREPTGPGSVLVQNGDNTGTFHVDLAGKAAGTYTLIVTVTDGTTPVQDQVTFTVTAPRPPLECLACPKASTQPANAPVSFTVGLNPVGTTVDHATYTVKRNGVEIANGTLAQGTGNAWTFAYTPTQPGTYQIYVKETDANGHESGQQNVGTFTVQGAAVDNGGGSSTSGLPVHLTVLLVLAVATTAVAGYGVLVRWKK